MTPHAGTGYKISKLEANVDNEVIDKVLFKIVLSSSKYIQICVLKRKTIFLNKI